MVPTPDDGSSLEFFSFGAIAIFPRPPTPVFSCISYIDSPDSLSLLTPVLGRPNHLSTYLLVPGLTDETTNIQFDWYLLGGRL